MSTPRRPLERRLELFCLSLFQRLSLHYSEILDEIADEPDYEAAVEAAREAAK